MSGYMGIKKAILYMCCQGHTLVLATFKQIYNLFNPSCSGLYKGPAIKKFMPLVVIIEAHDALRNFWIW